MSHACGPQYLTFLLADGWAFKNNVDIRQHQNLQDRMRAAHLLLAKSPQCPVVVDTMQNESSQLYAALPERLYVLQEGRILYKVVIWDRGTGRARDSTKDKGKEGFTLGRYRFKSCES